MPSARAAPGSSRGPLSAARGPPLPTLSYRREGSSALTVQRKGVCVGGTRLGSGSWGVPDCPDKCRAHHPKDWGGEGSSFTCPGVRLRGGGWVRGRSSSPPGHSACQEAGLLPGLLLIATKAAATSNPSPPVPPHPPALREAEGEGRGGRRGEGRGRTARGEMEQWSRRGAGRAPPARDPDPWLLSAEATHHPSPPHAPSAALHSKLSKQSSAGLSGPDAYRAIV